MWFPYSSLGTADYDHDFSFCMLISPAVTQSVADEAKLGPKGTSTDRTRVDYAILALLWVTL